MKQIILYWSERIQQGICRLCAFSYDRPLLVGLLLAVLLAVPISHVPDLKRDGSIEGFLRAEDPSLLSYNRFRQQFGQDGDIVIAIQAPNIFSFEFLSRLKQFHQALEQNVPFIEDMTSLYNVRDVKGKEHEFVVEDLLLHWPKDQADLDVLRAKVMANPLYRNLLIDPQGHMTTVTIKPDRYGNTGQSNASPDSFMRNVTPEMLSRAQTSHPFLTAQELGRMVGSVHKVAESFRGPDFRIDIAGSPTASSTIVQLLLADMSRYMLFSIGAILIFISVFTRRVVSAVLAATIIAATLFSTFGLMAISDVQIKPPTQVLLSIILVACICELIHILTHFYLNLQTMQDKRSAFLVTIEHTAIPVLYTSLTTAAGMLAFCSSDLAPIVDLGWFGAIAVLLALFLTWFMVPAMVRVLPIRPKRRGWGETIERAPRWTVRLAVASARRPMTAILLCMPIVISLLYGITKVQFAHNSLLWLPETNPTRQATEHIDGVMGGTVNLEIVLDTGRQFGIQDEAFLSRLETATRELPENIKSDVRVGKVVSVIDLLKETNQGLHGGSREYYRLPDRSMIAQSFLLFENSSSDALPYLVDSGYQKTRITLRVPWLEASLYAGFIGQVERYFGEAMGEGVKVQATGIMALIARTSTAVMQSLASSTIGSLVMIPSMMILLLASVRLGIVSMVPNILPIAMVLGIMGYLGIPLDTFSMLAGSIALGLIVDDSVHFFHNFAQAYRQREDVTYAITSAIEMTGRSIVNASFILASAFGSYMMASMNNVRSFGLVMVLVIFLAAMSDLVLSPSLLALLSRFGRKREKVARMGAPIPQNSQAYLSFEIEPTENATARR